MIANRMLCTIAALAAIVGLWSRSAATLRRVPSEYSTIQKAIDAALPGDTVLVSPGTYHENIRFRGKAITVASHYILDGDTLHRDSTIVDGGRPADPDSGSTVSFIEGEDTNSVLCGMTITGGTGTILAGLDYRLGGGIYLQHSGGRICHNRIVLNSVTHHNVAIGGGISAGTPYDTSGWLILEDNQIWVNRISGALGAGASGVFCGISARIVRNGIEANESYTTGSGVGGVNCYTESASRLELTLRGNVIRGNRVTSTGVDEYGQSGLGGGLVINGFRAFAENNIIADNVLIGPGKSYGAGVLLTWENDDLVFRNNSITGNRISGGGEHYGGGICIWRCNPKVYNNIIAGNEGTYGGGVFVGGDEFRTSRPQLMSNTIARNSGAEGRSLYSSGSYPVIVNSILWDQAPAIRRDGGNVTVLYSDAHGGWSGTRNIDVDPAFLDTTCRLSDSSQCIGSGIDSVQIEGVWYRTPSTDFADLPRPDPPRSRPDIGALEHPLAVGVKSSPLSITPAAIDFRNVRPGSMSDTLDILVLNRGASSREITALSFGKEEFFPAPPPVLPRNIPPFEESRFGVVFAPKAPGVVVCDTLLIATSDTLLPAASVLLQGRGSGMIQCAHPTILYGISSSPGMLQLFEVDRSSGCAKPVGEFSPDPPAGLSALTVRTRDSLLYAAFPSSAGTVLYRLSPEFGDLEEYRAITVRDVTSMAFSGSDDLYLVTGGGLMYSVKAGASDTSFVGSPGYQLTGLAFSPATGVLWASLHDTVFTVDTASGAATVVGWSGWNAPRSSITFNGLGVMYGLCGSWLVTIGKVSGEASEIGATGVADIVAIAMRSDVVTAIDREQVETPETVNLDQNYPNPFNPTTAIRYQLPAASDVRLAVYDLLGREVAVLVHERKGAGNHTAWFSGSRLASGVYVYKLRAGPIVQCKHMMLIK